MDDTIKRRNAAWSGNPYVPGWVNPDKVGLDQFYTRAEVAKACHASLLSHMQNDDADVAHYKFVEPGAGTGAFYRLLPADRRIGLDICPQLPTVHAADFLSWEPRKNGYRYAVVGNPPFGYRGWLALAFMNHAATFADYVGLILPMSFQSRGKGSPRLRVEGLRLAHTDYLPPDSFVDGAGNPAKINALWQIWQRGVNNEQHRKTCKQWLDLFTVDLRKERLCGQKKMTNADYFLQRTFFEKPPTLVKDFGFVKYVCGYGMIIKRDKRKVVSLLKNANWKKYSNLAAHNCRHISMYHIEQVLTDAGLVDEQRT